MKILLPRLYEIFADFDNWGEFVASIRRGGKGGRAPRLDISNRAGIWLLTLDESGKPATKYGLKKRAETPAPFATVQEAGRWALENRADAEGGEGSEDTRADRLWRNRYEAEGDLIGGAE